MGKPSNGDCEQATVRNCAVSRNSLISIAVKIQTGGASVGAEVSDPDMSEDPSGRTADINEADIDALMKAVEDGQMVDAVRGVLGAAPEAPVDKVLTDLQSYVDTEGMMDELVRQTLDAARQRGVAEWFAKREAERLADVQAALATRSLGGALDDERKGRYLQQVVEDVNNVLRGESHAPSDGEIRTELKKIADRVHGGVHSTDNDQQIAEHVAEYVDARGLSSRVYVQRPAIGVTNAYPRLLKQSYREDLTPNGGLWHKWMEIVNEQYVLEGRVLPPELCEDIRVGRTNKNRTGPLLILETRGRIKWGHANPDTQVLLGSPARIPTRIDISVSSHSVKFSATVNLTGHRDHVSRNRSESLHKARASRNAARSSAQAETSRTSAQTGLIANMIRLNWAHKDFHLIGRHFQIKPYDLTDMAQRTPRDENNDDYKLSSARLPAHAKGQLVLKQYPKDERYHAYSRGGVSISNTQDPCEMLGAHLEHFDTNVEGRVDLNKCKENGFLGLFADCGLWKKTNVHKNLTSCLDIHVELEAVLSLLLVQDRNATQNLQVPQLANALREHRLAIIKEVESQNTIYKSTGYPGTTIEEARVKLEERTGKLKELADYMNITYNEQSVYCIPSGERPDRAFDWYSTKDVLLKIYSHYSRRLARPASVDRRAFADLVIAIINSVHNELWDLSIAFRAAEFSAQPYHMGEAPLDPSCSHLGEAPLDPHWSTTEDSLHTGCAPTPRAFPPGALRGSK